ncbi:MAG: transposase [Planctomycetota bacterium]|nr:transposase [Planctomycetota bacterium]
MLAHHIIFGTYGFWLPNDPRGSWSDFVGSWELYRYGSATKTTETQSLAYIEHDSASRKAAKQSLKYPPVLFNGIQARAVARGFARYVERTGLRIWACAILPDHVHLVTEGTKIPIKHLVIQLKGDATEQLMRERIHPMTPWQTPGSRVPKCWARGEWKVYLDEEDEVYRAIEYVKNNPVKEGKKQQAWSFAQPLQ